MAAEKHIHRKSSKERHLAASSQLWAKPRLTAQESSYPTASVCIYLSKLYTQTAIYQWYQYRIHMIYTVCANTYRIFSSLRWQQKQKKPSRPCFQDADNVKALIAGATPLVVSLVRSCRRCCVGVGGGWVTWVTWVLLGLSRKSQGYMQRARSKYLKIPLVPVKKACNGPHSLIFKNTKTRCVIKSLEDLLVPILYQKKCQQNFSELSFALHGALLIMNFQLLTSWAESWAIQHRGVALKWWNELCVCYASNTSCIQNSLYFWWEKGNDWLRLQNPNVFQISSYHWPLSWAHGGLWSCYMKNFLASLVHPRHTTFLLI